MKATAVDRFGGADELTLHTLPVPDIGANDVLISVDTAGIGVWDPADREGAFAEMMEGEPSFPYVLGMDGAGTVVAVSENVTRFDEGDRVYAFGNPGSKARFYQEYTAVEADNAAPVPEGHTRGGGGDARRRRDGACRPRPDPGAAAR